MPHNSLNNLLKKFPYFFDKSESSNFFKSQKVTNNQFQKIYQDLMNTYHSFHLNKRLLVWKEQSVPYEYVMHFVATFPLLKRVVIYCNDDIIYEADFVLTTEDFSYLSVEKFHSYTFVVDENDEENIQITHDIHTQEHTIAENITTFNYSHESVSDSIIPQENYLISVTTFDEYTYSKGFPENDTIIGNEYDHDISLDEIGEENNIPRKQYLTIDEDKYQESELIDRYNQTEHLFNNQSTEDDYHYMKRILEYLIRVQNQPLPVAEIWKLYGIDNVSLLNRGRLLLKMFDPMKHDPLISDDGEVYVSDWVPEAWEHKDGFCKTTSINDLFFFVTVNTTSPKKFSSIYFEFKFLNIYGESVEVDDFKIDLQINDNETLTLEDYRKLSYSLDTSVLDEININTLKFTAKNNVEDIIGEQVLLIKVKGCGDGDWYVTSNGDDNNDGSRNAPFRTLGKAISKLNKNQDMIIVGGDVVLDDLHTINIPCTIMGCNNGTLISYREDNKFLNVGKDNNVTLTDLNLSHNYAISYCKSETYYNDNEDYENKETVIIHGGLPVLTIIPNQEDYYHLYDNIILDFNIRSLKDNPLQFTPLKFYIDNEYFSTIYSDENGDVRVVLHFENDNPLEHSFKIEFDETDVFWENEFSKLVNFHKNTPRINRLYGRLLTLTAEYSSKIDLYENNIKRHESTFEDNLVTNTYLPDYGEHIVYFSPEGTQVIQEWVIDARFYISDLNVSSLVTNVEIDSNGKLFVTKTPLSDFKTLKDLENVIIDLSIENDKLYKANFIASNLDGLTGNELYPVDLRNMQNALVDVTMSSDGKLSFERISTIIIEEED